MDAGRWRKCAVVRWGTKSRTHPQTRTGCSSWTKSARAGPQCTHRPIPPGRNPPRACDWLDVSHRPNTTTLRTCDDERKPFANVERARWRAKPRPANPFRVLYAVSGCSPRPPLWQPRGLGPHLHQRPLQTRPRHQGRDGRLPRLSLSSA